MNKKTRRTFKPALGADMVTLMRNRRFEDPKRKSNRNACRLKGKSKPLAGQE